MSTKYPIEQLLRPPVELAATLAYGCGGLLALLSPGLLLTVPSVAYLLATFCFYRCAVRTHTSVRLLRYQVTLLVLPCWEISSSQLPMSQKDIFLGRGFDWEAIHTLRQQD